MGLALVRAYLAHIDRGVLDEETDHYDDDLEKQDMGQKNSRLQAEKEEYDADDEYNEYKEESEALTFQRDQEQTRGVKIEERLFDLIETNPFPAEAVEAKGLLDELRGFSFGVALVGKGNVLLWNSIIFDNMPMLEYLLQEKQFLGVELDKRFYVDGGTLLSCAVSRDNEAAVRLLLQAGANVDTPNADGDTPLHLACRLGMGGLGMIKILREANASVDVPNNKGQTALELAQQWSQSEELLDDLSPPKKMRYK